MSAAGTGLHVRGRAWVFGDEVNTDEMFPGFANRLPIKEAAQTMFNASRPSWPALVRPGDIVVARRNFGRGSSRPVALLFQQLGVSALLAEHINSLFFRNSINYGLAALTVPGITAHVTEGDELVVDVTAATVRHTADGRATPRVPAVDPARRGTQRSAGARGSPAGARPDPTRGPCPDRTITRRRR